MASAPQPLTDADIWGSDTSTPDAPAPRDAEGNYVVTVDKSTNPDFVAKQPPPPPPKGMNDNDIWGSSASPPPPTTVGGVASQAGQGLLNSLVGGANTMLSAMPAGPFAARAAQSLMDYGAPLLSGKPAGAADALADLAGPGLKAPQFAGNPGNLAERTGRLGGELLPALAFGPEADAGALANIAFRGKNLLYPLATGTAAGEATKAMGGTPGQVSTMQGIGSIPGSIAAIPSALEGIGGIIGNTAKPFLANISQGAREGQAGQILANAAGSGFDSAKSALAGYKPLVEGSPATVDDVTGNLGLIGLSRGVATKNSPEYAALTAGQNEARTASLHSLSPNADPMAVRTHIQGTVDNLDAKTQGEIDAATQVAQVKAHALGGVGNPEEYGATIRDNVTSALKASDAREKGLWDAIDPDQSLTGNVTATRLAGKNITSNVSQYDVPMNADEQRIFGQVAAMPDVMPLRDIVALRKSINDAASTEMATNGSTATYGRLSALRGALADNLTNTISDAVTKPGVAAKVAEWEKASEPTSEVRSGVGGAGQPPSGGGTEAISPASGTALPQGGGPGSAAGTQGVSGQISPDLKPVMMGKQVVGYTTPDGQTISAAAARAYQPPSTGAPTTPELTGPLADIRPPTENVGQVISASFNNGRRIGNQIVPTNTLTGGVSSASGEQSRVNDLANQMAGENGFFRRLIVDQDGNVIEGQHRLEAARQLGLTHVPIVRVQDIEANFPSAAVKSAITASKMTHPDHVNQLTGQLAEAFQDEGSAQGVRENYEPPKGFETQWNAGLDALDGGKKTPSGPGQPTIDADAQARMKAANAATAEQAQTFRQGPVAPTMKTAGYAGQYTMPNGAVPGQFFKAGPTGYESMQSLAKASPEAMPAIQDYAASTLKDMALKPDGTIDPKGFERWMGRYGDSIRALPPDQQAVFADAATASKTVADATVARTEALKTAQSGAIGRILGVPPDDPAALTKTVGRILGGETGGSDMASLVAVTKSNPQAAAGLKQAVIDHITDNYISNTEAAASGTNKIKADAYQTFMRTARPALSQVLAPPEMARLDAIAADIHQSQRTLGATKLAGQSNTSQDMYAGGLPGGGKPSALIDYLIGGAASTVGGLAHGWLGAGVGEGLGALGADLVQRLRLGGINKVNDLVSRAVFDPDVAASLMQKVSGPQDLTPKSNAGRALLRALIAPTSAVVATKPQSQAPTTPSTPSALQGVPLQ